MIVNHWIGESNLSALDLLIGIHNHQPVGNFGHVFEECFNMCYQPQISLLEKWPGVRMSIHHSGPLLDWIESNHPGYIDTVAKLVDRGQVEILSGGYYEPILSSIPEDDAIGQVMMMNEYIKKRFGRNPAGMWAAERIWDPGLPKIINAAGLKFTLLDDTHFYYAGLESGDMFGYYMTEKNGATVAVFPIDKTLRYTIPFKEPHETIDYLKHARQAHGADGVTYGDDGEKFGVWPGTHQWVFEEKWLEKFYGSLMENSDHIRTSFFSEYLDRRRSKGRIYLPVASYDEMMEWSLPVNAGAKYENAMRELGDMGKLDEWKPFIRGGMWDNFLVKYEESNRMHKKMLRVSERLGEIPTGQENDLVTEARIQLYQGQCNCAYWHGLFGGLYLNYLRHAVYNRIIEAEKLVDRATGKTGEWIDVTKLDFNKDGSDEIVVENRSVSALFNPACGASLTGLDYRPAGFCLTNTLTRREEVYHRKIREQAAASGNGDQPASIHDIVHFKEEGLDKKLVYDLYDRHCFQDRFMDPSTSMDDFVTQRYAELGDFIGGSWDVESVETDGKALITMAREGALAVNGENEPVRIRKTFSVNTTDPAVSASYEVTNLSGGSLEFCMGVEFNLTLLASDAGDRYWTGLNVQDKPRLKTAMAEKGITSMGMRDDFFGFEVSVSSDTPFDCWRFPVETVSQSESGFESTYQGSCMVALRRISLAPGQKRTFTMTLAADNTK